MQLLLNLFRGRTNRVNNLGPFLQQAGQGGVVGVLVLASKNEMDAAGEGSHGLAGGIDVSGFGVVVKLNAIAGPYEFETMLDRLELRDGGSDTLGRNSRETSHADRRQHILDVVRPLQGVSPQAASPAG